MKDSNGKERKKRQEQMSLRENKVEILAPAGSYDILMADFAAGADAVYLGGAMFGARAYTVVNSLAIVSGIVCDGAKASCAAKIASAVEAGILGYNMYIRGQQFYGGDGIVTKGVEETLQNVGRLGKEGMKETNEEIIKIMIGE